MAKAIGIAFKVIGWLIIAVGVLWLLSKVASDYHDDRVEGLLIGLGLIIWYSCGELLKALERVRAQVALLASAIRRD